MEWTMLIEPAVFVAGLGLLWKEMGKMEKRITDNADKAHAAIGQRITEIRNDLGQRVGRIEEQNSMILNHLLGNQKEG